MNVICMACEASFAVQISWYYKVVSNFVSIESGCLMSCQGHRNWVLFNYRCKHTNTTLDDPDLMPLYKPAIHKLPIDSKFAITGSQIFSKRNIKSQRFCQNGRAIMSPLHLHELLNVIAIPTKSSVRLLLCEITLYKNITQITWLKRSCCWFSPPFLLKDSFIKVSGHDSLNDLALLLH